MYHSGGNPGQSDLQAGVECCQECHRLCLTTMSHCQETGGAHAAPTHIGLLLDCAQICHTSAEFMLRRSRFHTQLCAVCAEVCERCAQSCEWLGAGDPELQACAKACRACAESCRAMAA